MQVTHSDQETLYFFRRMVRDIDGFWLFPDNRILSGRVLQEMLADANRQQVPVTVPSDAMLEMGATLSISTVAADIARTIVKVIREVQSGRLESLPPITQLSRNPCRNERRYPGRRAMNAALASRTQLGRRTDRMAPNSFFTQVDRRVQSASLCTRFSPSRF